MSFFRHCPDLVPVFIHPSHPPPPHIGKILNSHFICYGFHLTIEYEHTHVTCNIHALFYLPEILIVAFDGIHLSPIFMI